MDLKTLPRLPIMDGQLMQLFQNLITNSLKFTSEQKQPLVQIACITDSNWHTFSIADNGIGIPQGQTTAVFQRFTRLHTDTKYDGSGLGLATCKQILQRCGGDIWFDSQLGQGTTFYFRLPITPTETILQNAGKRASLISKTQEGLLFFKALRAAFM